jgi:hypothetical protein
MDTDDLSNELYKAIFITAEKFHDDLTLQFGLLASDCEEEPEYIKKAEALIKKYQKNPKRAIGDIFFEKPPSTEKFIQVLQDILGNIEKVKQIPIEKDIIVFKQYRNGKKSLNVR